MLQLIIILLWMSRKETFIANYKHKDYKGEIDQINWGIAWDWTVWLPIDLSSCAVQIAEGMHLMSTVQEHRNCGLSNPVSVHTRQSYPVPVQTNQRLGFGGLKRKDWIKKTKFELYMFVVVMWHLQSWRSVCCSSTYMGQNSAQT